MGRRRLLRELDSYELSEQMAFDILDNRDVARASRRSLAPSPMTPAAPPRPASPDETIEALTSVFLKMPGATMIGPT